MPGIKDVTVDFNKKTATVNYDDSKIKAEGITAALSEQSQGKYTAEPQQAERR